jgi:hypothetical protein
MNVNPAARESEVDDYVHRYRTLRKKSFDSVIALAKLVIDAEIKLEHRFETFLGLIELDRDSSTYRKYEAIAKAAPRLELYRDNLPPCWTTLYQLAKLKPDEFEQIKSCFHPHLTARELAVAIAELKSPQPSADPPVCERRDDTDEPNKLAEPVSANESDKPDKTDYDGEPSKPFLPIESNASVKPNKPVKRPTPDAFNEPDEEPKIVISLKKLSQEQRQRLREQLAQLRATFLFEMIESTTAERVLADVA